MKLARNFFISVGIAAMLLTIVACQKSGNKSEETLVVETLPLANGHVEAPAPGPDFPLKVTIKSAMPSGGVKIDITAKLDGGTVAFFTTSRTSSTAINDFTITGTTVGVVSVAELTVTSVSTSTNKWSGSYKYSRK